MDGRAEGSEWVRATQGMTKAIGYEVVLRSGRIVSRVWACRVRVGTKSASMVKMCEVDAARMARLRSRLIGYGCV